MQTTPSRALVCHAREGLLELPRRGRRGFGQLHNRGGPLPELLRRPGRGDLRPERTEPDVEVHDADAVVRGDCSVEIGGTVCDNPDPRLGLTVPRPNAAFADTSKSITRWGLFRHSPSSDLVDMILPLTGGSPPLSRQW